MSSITHRARRSHQRHHPPSGRRFAQRRGKRVTMELLECAAYLRAHDNYLLVTHQRPDGDTLGSASALCHALRRLGKTAHLYKNPEITEMFVPFISPYYAPEGFVPETCVSVDVAENKLLACGFEGKISLKLDHHVPRGEQPENAVIWTHSAACGELVLALIDALVGGPDKRRPTFSISPSPPTRAASATRTPTAPRSALPRAFATPGRICRCSTRSFSAPVPGAARARGHGVLLARSYRDHAINIAVITLDMLRRAGVTEDDCSDLASLAGQVRGNRGHNGARASPLTRRAARYPCARMAAWTPRRSAPGSAAADTKWRPGASWISRRTKRRTRCAAPWRKYGRKRYSASR